MKKNAKKDGKRILLIAPQPFYEDRGTPIAIQDTLVALSALGFKVDLATFPIGSEVALKGVKLFRTANPLGFQSIPIGFSIRKVVLDICLLSTVFRLAKKKYYDCVHGVEEGAALGLACKVFFGIPVIYDMQSSLPEQLREVMCFKVGPGRWLSLCLERWLVRKADCIVASKGLADHVQSIEPGKAVFECAFDGYDPIKRDENMAKTVGTFGRPTVIYTGNFAPYQGLDILMESITLVRAEIPNVIFLLVGGTGNEIIRLSRLLDRYKLDGCVKMLERRPRMEMPDYMALADVLVLPRLVGKNAPLKLYDYLKSGTPIVATDIPAHRVLLSEETAILVRPDSRSISDGILQALKHTQRANKFVSATKNSIRCKEMKPLAQTIAEAYGFVFRSMFEKVE